MYERILVPLDGSEMAEAALDYVQLLPSRRIRLLAIEHEEIGISAICKAARDCKTYLENSAEPLRQQGRDVETSVALGNPAEQILAFAGTADLVLMGSHGHGLVERFMLGSVADQVARHATVPTIIVRDRQVPAVAVRLARIVVPLDGSPLAERALPAASMLAADLGVPIHLIRVLEIDAVRAAVQAGMHVASAYLHSQEDVQRRAEEYLAERAQELREQRLTATSEVLLGSPGATLLDAIRPDDLVVMTSHARGGVRRWLLGSIADRLVRAAAGPVLLVPTADAATLEDVP
jgi:nucleotide-binding universal stress UspA family protein